MQGYLGQRTEERKRIGVLKDREASGELVTHAKRASAIKCLVHTTRRDREWAHMNCKFTQSPNVSGSDWIDVFWSCLLYSGLRWRQARLRLQQRDGRGEVRKCVCVSGKQNISTTVRT
jgi:hypothetical protein